MREYKKERKGSYYVIKQKRFKYNIFIESQKTKIKQPIILQMNDNIVLVPFI